MNILHISDLHFGTRHWEGNDQVLLAKLNSYNADMSLTPVTTQHNTTQQAGWKPNLLMPGAF